MQEYVGKKRIALQALLENCSMAVDEGLKENCNNQTQEGIYKCMKPRLEYRFYFENFG